MPGSVTIPTPSGTVFPVYGTQAAMLAYHNGSLGTEAAALLVATADQQAKALVEATRMINRQGFIDPVTTFALRDAFVDAEAQPIFQWAAYELAPLLLSDPDLKANPTSGSNVASVGAGPAQVSFFRPTLGQTGRFPTIIKELLGAYLSGSVSSADGVANSYGTDGESAFDDEDIYGIDRSF